MKWKIHTNRCEEVEKIFSPVMRKKDIPVAFLDTISGNKNKNMEIFLKTSSKIELESMVNRIVLSCHKRDWCLDSVSDDEDSVYGSHNGSIHKKNTWSYTFSRVGCEGNDLIAYHFYFKYNNISSHLQLSYDDYLYA